MAHYFHVTQTGSDRGTIKAIRATLRGLGLTKLGKSANVPDTEPVRGMLMKVHYLIKVERVEGERPSKGGSR